VEAALWRIWNKYVIKLHPIGIFYLLSIFLIAAGLIASLFSNYLVIIFGAALFIASVMCETIADARLYSKTVRVR
jgi:Na+/serine symporter